MNKKERGKKVLGNVFRLFVLPLGLTIIFTWRIGLASLVFFGLMKLLSIKRRKYFAKDMKGDKLGFKEFMKRWKLGIEGITPLQQAKTNLMGTWIVISGILGGIIINALVRIGTQWIWIEVILVGSLIVTVMQMIGGLQKYWRFKETDKVQKQFEKELKENMKKKK